MQSPSKYEANLVEPKWYNYWMTHKYFHSTPDHREPYTIVIPPPNVTGVLHMGHMLNNTIQDVLIRHARLMGKNACWVPGTDHASIATEAKVVAKLKDQGIDKNTLTREEFLKHAWEWTHQYGGVILEQLKKLGCSCDWDRTKFTMDDNMSQSVIKVFVDLYNKGLIYRGYRMVNWDPEAKTTLSDEEVIYEENQSTLFYINYKIDQSAQVITIATTRPETIFGDVAICVHPNDERYKHLKGKHAIIPICNRLIPIIEDDYIDIEFGTGCLKVTPAHDQNDKIIGDKYNLEVIDVFNDDATLNQHGLHYQGQDRFVVRKAIAKELEALGHIVKTELHTNSIGRSERTKAIIEPRLSDQWFVKMEDLVKPAIQAVLGEQPEINFYPKKFENTYRHWMENIRDWNISRQLIWGQQIPAYYFGPNKAHFVVANNSDEALQLAQQQSGNTALKIEDLTQDKDALDTWFSSWLWPISVFDGINNPNNPDINYYYPTNDLVTAPDILFFWVARMIISGYEYKQQKPFNNVYLTGIVRDKQRRKMSKSLGNSPDALKLIETYSADGVRVGLLLSSAAGNDLLFDETLCQQGKAFSNKIWNAFKLVSGWEVYAQIPMPETNKIALEWYTSKFQMALLEIEEHFSKYRLSDALMCIYKLIFNDFCGWFLEMIKPEFGKPIDKSTLQTVISIFENNLKIAHPFMPFITEEIWQSLAPRTPQEALIIAQWPSASKVNQTIINEFEFASEIISGIRNIRKEKNISFKESITCFEINNEKRSTTFNGIIKKLGNIATFEVANEGGASASRFRVKSNEYFVPIEGVVDVETQKNKLLEELNYTQGFLSSVQKKLANEKFVNNAPEPVLISERKKEADALAKIETLKASLANMG